MTAPLQPLREMVRDWPHDFLADTDDVRHSGYLADSQDDQSEWVCIYDPRCRRCKIEAFCDAAEAEVRERANVNEHLIVGADWVRAALIGEKEQFNVELEEN